MSALQVLPHMRLSAWFTFVICSAAAVLCLASTCEPQGPAGTATNQEQRCLALDDLRIPATSDEGAEAESEDLSGLPGDPVFLNFPSDVSVPAGSDNPNDSGHTIALRDRSPPFI